MYVCAHGTNVEVREQHCGTFMSVPGIEPKSTGLWSKCLCLLSLLDGPSFLLFSVLIKEYLSIAYWAESLKTIGPDDVYPMLADVGVNVCIHQPPFDLSYAFLPLPSWREPSIVKSGALCSQGHSCNLGDNADVCVILTWGLSTVLFVPFEELKLRHLWNAPQRLERHKYQETACHGVTGTRV